MAVDDKVVMLAKKDLARRRNISAERIVLKHIEGVDWSDTSLGCPEERKAYAQVITPGYRLVLSTGTAEFEYHTDKHVKSSAVPPRCQPIRQYRRGWYEVT